MTDGFLAIAPTDVGTEFNTFQAALRPIAVWELGDAHFAFDSSVILPSMTAELLDLIALIRGNPDAPVAIFGHADPTGEDGYNKLLSGRRARALFALLTRGVDHWEHLAAHPMGRDDWHRQDQAAQAMRSTVESPRAGPPTPLSGRLMRQYMDSIGVDGDGKAFSVPASRFLGKGEDPEGRADFQGCGEFNPRLVFSAAEAKEFSGPKGRPARDDANAVNRRVTVMLFRPGTTVGTRWPCPRASEGVAGCRKRFWSDGESRRAPQAIRREQPTGGTYACRFYDRLIHAVPKEVLKMYGCKYRGIIVNTDDPASRGRVQVKVPDVLGEQVAWALPCVPYAGPGVGFLPRPPVGANVWVEFEGGKPELPIWTGCFWGDGESMVTPLGPLTAIHMEVGHHQEISIRAGGSHLTVSGIPTESIVLRTGKDERTKLELTPDNLDLTTGAGARIQMSPTSVNINDGALVVT